MKCEDQRRRARRFGHSNSSDFADAAVMMAGGGARVRDVLRTQRLPAFFTGHREDGAPALSEDAPHLASLFDPLENQLLVVAPEHLEHRTRQRHEEKNLAILESALQDFRELRAGADGFLRIRPISLDLVRHRLFTPSHVWESVTPYQVNRHARRSTAEQILKNDLVAECERRGLPRPEISVLDWNAKPETGLRGRVRLTFRDAVPGPIILGKTRHIGGGVFSAVENRVPHDGSL